MKQRMTVKIFVLQIKIFTVKGATLKATLLSLKIRLRPRLCLRQFFKIFENFRNLAPGVASGYAPGQIKICIFPQAMPQAIYSTIIGLRRKFSPRRALRICPRANKNLHIPSRRLKICINPLRVSLGVNYVPFAILCNYIRT
ncbi:hypothetical protein T05_12629 [Trichinella murrelli]|uniref:Uncharacterized protein n=1 Tax=Trichinella murrelli TaxID=144512 RepID=A0A0V0TM73_9BILA|nr:hypothetical protein T05_12629 [Trichinella murrelli]